MRNLIVGCDLQQSVEALLCSAYFIPFKGGAWLYQAAWIKQRAIATPVKGLNSIWTVFVLVLCLFFHSTSTARIVITLGFNFIKDVKIKAFQRTLLKMEWSCSQFSTMREKQTTFPHSQNHYSLIQKLIENQTNKATKTCTFFLSRVFWSNFDMYDICNS